ncbi:MAG: hypothetical protein A2070_12205 [Bdellovibrionales bacterium GWC1_52_8]|nr:MAG: hypothetical protein A2Z97_11615 [Bdellovibrionales bacterium GWB1_52_6]OFZ03914.1 MAG: hypothetical protein A2X97_16100 [Bdellovibrionales bacterium GWA1_52_35]OFZ37408.1 MAG: hypothetical protein A2070_12205 [Bdellovibrionales bacterium GWC1_52_8]
MSVAPKLETIEKSGERNHQESMRSISQNVIQTVRTLSEEARFLDQIGKDSNELADHSSSIASAAEELGTTIVSIGKNLENTMGASTQAKTLANNGTAVIDTTVSRIAEVDEILTSTNTALQELLNTADQADKIIRVVSDISSKTDLLALNASIEAARAGAAGKGFAVVAHEVGRLAEKTQASISEIETIIKSIKSSVHEVSKRLDKGLDCAKHSVREATNAKNAIDSIVERINFVDNEVSNINAAIRDQGQAVSDIAVNVYTISQGGKSVNTEVIKVTDMVDTATRSLNETRLTLSGLESDDKIQLEHMKIDHLYVVHRLRRMIAGREQARADELSEHTLCPLGKWYYSVRSTGQTDAFSLAYKDLETPHKQFHATAVEIAKALGSGNTQEAARAFEQLVTLANTIVQLLDRITDSYVS